MKLGNVEELAFPSNINDKNIHVCFSRKICQRYADMGEKDRHYLFRGYKTSRYEIGTNPGQFVPEGFVEFSPKVIIPADWITITI